MRVNGIRPGPIQTEINKERHIIKSSNYVQKKQRGIASSFKFSSNHTLSITEIPLL